MSFQALDNDTRPRFDGFAQPHMKTKGPFTVEAAGFEKKDGETIPRRHPLAKDKLFDRPSSDVSTTYENLKRSAKKFGNNKAIGTRKLIKEHV
jgi:long-chain acyl-CoA synthetase